LLAELRQQTSSATLNEVASKALLSCYGLPVSREEIVTSEDAAAAAAARIGYPVVAKIVSAALPHKSDIGGVKVNLKDEAALRAAYRTIMANVAALPNKPAVDGVLIAEMVSGQLECVLGAKLDPEMGPVVLFGSGGVDLELTRDVALAACPLDEAAALQLMARTRAGTIAGGYRGRPVLDRKALAQALVALSHLMIDAQGAIAEVDVNPVLVSEKGAVALDGLIVLNR
jgi:acetyltransferase